jgi:hypothetical protein
MDTQDREQEAVSPRKLLAAFTGGHIFFWIVAAMLIHTVLIGGLSLTFIRDRWIDPDGARIRKEAAEKAKKDEAQIAADKARREQARIAKTNQPPEGASTTNAVSGSSTNAAAGGTNAVAAVEGLGAVPPDRAGAAVIRRITAVAASNEIPGEAALGISIEETNKK